MKRLRNLLSLLPLTILTGCIGCTSSDERVTEVAQQAMLSQRLQNEQIAEQSKAVIQHSQKLTEAAKELVVRDAEARGQLIEAQKHLQSELNQQQSTLDASRSGLETERQAIAKQRYRDPVVANSIQSTGLLLACCLPLVVCVYLIRQLMTDDSDETALAEMLVLELASEQPLLRNGSLGPSPHRLSSSAGADYHRRAMAHLNDAMTDVPASETDQNSFTDDCGDSESEPPPF